jgi:hypothetical protein
VIYTVHRTSRLASSKICAAPMKRDGPHERTSQRRPRTNKQYRQSLPPFLAVHRHRAMALHSCASILAAHCSLVQAAAQLVGLAACECAIEHAPENGSDTGIRTRKKPQVNASKMCTSSSIGDLACTHGAGEAIRHELQQTNERERERDGFGIVYIQIERWSEAYTAYRSR